MGRKAVYRKDITSVQVSQLASVLLGMQRRFNETKGDVIERIILETIPPELVENIRKELNKKLENVKQKKLDVQQHERRLRQTDLTNDISYPKQDTSNNIDIYDPNKTFTTKEICKYILERNNLPVTSVLMLSADVKFLPKYLKSGEIIQVSEDEYRIAPIAEN